MASIAAGLYKRSVERLHQAVVKTVRDHRAGTAPSQDRRAALMILMMVSRFYRDCYLRTVARGEPEMDKAYMDEIVRQLDHVQAGGLELKMG